MRVLAVDPGKATGYAYFDELGELETGELWRHEFVSLAASLMLARQAPLALVVERYTITAATLKKSRQVDALKIIGALEYLAWNYGAQLVTQPTGVAGRVSVKQLRALGWNRPTPGGHANMAVRHLVQYLATQDADFAGRLLDAAG